MPPEDFQERRPGRRSNSLIAGIVILIVLVVGGFLAWKAISNSAPAEEPAPTPEAPVVTDTRASYASSTMKFSLRYPQEFTLQEPYAYTRVSPTKPISGVKFAVPVALTEGTNLAPDSGVSVETLPRANLCTGDIYLKANVKAQPTTSGAITYSVATSTETVGADTFEEAVFAIPGTSPCIAMRYFLHTVAATGTASTTPYDRTAVLTALESIRNSLTLQ
jgi:hypothetical protein